MSVKLQIIQASAISLLSFNYYSDLFIPGLFYFLLFQREGVHPGAAAGNARGWRRAETDIYGCAFMPWWGLHS